MKWYYTRNGYVQNMFPGTDQFDRLHSEQRFSGIIRRDHIIWNRRYLSSFWASQDSPARTLQ